MQKARFKGKCVLSHLHSFTPFVISYLSFPLIQYILFLDRGPYCLHHQDYVEDSKLLQNVVQYLPDYIVLSARRRPSSKLFTLGKELTVYNKYNNFQFSALTPNARLCSCVPKVSYSSFVPTISNNLEPDWDLNPGRSHHEHGLTRTVWRSDVFSSLRAKRRLTPHWVQNNPCHLSF